MPIGVESAHGFGDLCFNIGLIRKLKEKYNDEMWVATRPHCKDALYNIPWIDKIIEIPQMNQGIPKLKSLGCSPVFQITQNVRFFEFRQQDPKHSLIDTPLHTGRKIGVDDFDQRPIFIPTATEIDKTNAMLQDRPTIAIESVYNSAQSWADSDAFKAIITKFDNYRILWLSNQNAPNHPNVDDLLRFSRREVIMCLRACDIFFSVGSGFFCASLALPKKWQPRKIICLWKDELYKYEGRLAQMAWHDDITWVHGRDELNQCLQNW